MKKLYNIRLLPVIILLLAVTFSSCKKDTDGSPDISAGTPVLGTITPIEGEGGTMVTITGTGLGDMRSIIFGTNNVPTSVMSTLNTESSILFRVPDTAYGGPQKIILTNSAGNTLEVDFDVIALPIVSSAFPSDFQEGSTITLTGNNLDDVSSVVIDGTTDEATIVSQTRKSIVITMPASSVNNAKLKLTNVSGTSVTSLSFVNIDQALQVYTDVFNGWENWSWGISSLKSQATDMITGDSCLVATFDPASAWGAMSLHQGTSVDITGYNYFTFWVKSTSPEKQCKVLLDWAGPADEVFTNTWTYRVYKISDYWSGKTSVNDIIFQIHDAGETLYFDNIVFIK